MGSSRASPPPFRIVNQMSERQHSNRRGEGAGKQPQRAIENRLAVDLDLDIERTRRRDDRRGAAPSARMFPRACRVGWLVSRSRALCQRMRLGRCSRNATISDPSHPTFCSVPGLQRRRADFLLEHVMSVLRMAARSATTRTGPPRSACGRRARSSGSARSAGRRGATAG